MKSYGAFISGFGSYDDDDSSEKFYIEKAAREEKMKKDFIEDFPYIISALEKMNRGDLLFKIYEFFMKTYSDVPIRSAKWIEAMKGYTPKNAEALCKLGAKTASEQTKLLQYCTSKSVFPKGSKFELWSGDYLNYERASLILFFFKQFLPITDILPMAVFVHEMFYGNDTFTQGYKSINFPYSRKKQDQYIKELAKLTKKEAQIMCRRVVVPNPKKTSICDQYKD